MAQFRYRARSSTGAPLAGLMTADSADQAAQRLVASGALPIDIQRQRESGAVTLRALARRIGFERVATADLVMFSRQMYTIVKSGIPLLRGMRGLASSTHQPVLRETLDQVLEDLESGRDLATCLGRHPQVFPSLYVSVVRVGEATGTLERSFLRLTEHLAQEQEMRERVKGAVRYPLIVIGTIVLAAVFLATFVIPKFEPIFRALQGDIPLPTRLVMGVAVVTRDWWHVSAGVLAVLAVGLARYVDTPVGRRQWDQLKLRVPVMGPLAYQAALARLCRSLAISLSAGLPMIQALQVIGRSAGNVHLAEKIQTLTTVIERGEPLSRAATASGLFTPLVQQMMAIGEETGQLPELLDEAAGFYEREVDAALKTLSASIEPLLIVGVGGMVLVLALGIFMPMWEMIGRAGMG